MKFVSQGFRGVDTVHWSEGGKSMTSQRVKSKLIINMTISGFTIAMLQYELSFYGYKSTILILINNKNLNVLK